MDHRFIAKQMCQLTEEMLWKPRRDWALKRNPKAALTTRVGSGNKTYLSHHRDMSVSGQMTITYGLKMVASKANPDTMCGWRSSRELRERGYYGGELNMLNLLAHTMAHEFAHLVQVLLDWRHINSVHNADFYRVLDRIHASEDAVLLRDSLHRACLGRGIDLSRIGPSDRAMAAMSGRHVSGEKMLALADVRPGETLWFVDADGRQFNPVKALKKVRGKLHVESLAPGKRGVRLVTPAALLSKTAP